MRLRFSHVALDHVLYDRRTIAAPARGVPRVDIAAGVAEGNLLALGPSEDGDDDQEATIELFIDEPIDPELERRAKKKHQSELRAPSGRIVVADTHKGELLETDEHNIPPGHYQVTWFPLDWGDEPNDAGDAAAKAADPTGFTAEKLMGPITGALIVITLIALGWAGCNTVTSDTPVMEAWRTARWYVLGFAVAWALVLLLWRVTGAGKASRAREQRHDEFADFVVHLQRKD